MLQVLYLDVSKVTRMLYLPPRFLQPRLGVSSSASRRWLGIHRTLSLFLDASDIQCDVGPAWARENGAENGYRRGRPETSRLPSPIY